MGVWLVGAVMALSAIDALAAAADFPERPVRMVVPFAPGGFTDVVARLVARQLSAAWSHSVIVDNRPGAAGTIGANLAIRANPDGHTLLLGSNSTFTVNPAVYTKLPYDVGRDLAIVGLVAFSPHVLIVRSGLPAATVSELVALAKRQPGKFTFASSGAGAVIHMAGELFKYQAAIDIVHVPFKGGGPAAIAMLAGEVDMMVNDAGPVMPHVRSGKLKILAVANDKRSPLLPDVPTFEESGLAGVISSSWAGLAAPVKVPRAILDRLNAAVSKMGTDRQYQQSLSALGMEPMNMDSQQAAAFVKQEFDKWSGVAKRANVTLSVN